MQPGDAPSEAPVERRGVKALAVAVTIGQVCALARYTLLARILGPAELGLAVTIVLSAQFFDSVTDSGNDRFLIQDRNGDAPEAQRLVQLVAVSRGVLTAALLCILAGPIAAFYQTPSLVLGLTLLAIAPFITGFVHLDLRRMQRHHDFRIEALAAPAAEVASLIATSAYAWFSHSYLAIVAGLIVRAVVLVGVTQVMAKRRYAIGYSKELARRVALFGAPLMVNGLLLFFGSQSDRLFIGRYMGLAELGRYSSLILLIFYPMSVLQKFTAGIFLPQLTASSARREAAADRFGGLIVVITIAAAAGFLLTAPFAAPLLFGPRYSHSLYIIALVGVLSALRFARSWPTNIALGLGKSGIVLSNNLVRLMGVPLALASVTVFGTLSSILISFTIGEFAALVVSLVLVHRSLNRPLTGDLVRTGVIALTGIGVVVAGWAIDQQWLGAVPVVLACVAVTVLHLALREQATFRWVAGMFRGGSRRV